MIRTRHRQVAQIREDAARERDDLREAMEARVQAAEAELTRRDREHSAEFDRIQAAAEARATVLEEARADLRARAERAERELDRARGGREEGTPASGGPQRRRRGGQDQEPGQ